MTRRTFLAAAGAAATLSLAGCKPRKRARSGVITLNFLSYAGEGYLDFYQRYLIPAFEKAHPHIEINLTTNLGDANYDTKLLTLIAGGIAPDLFHVTQQNFPNYAAKNILLPLDEIIERDGEFPLKDYYDRVLNEMRYGGRLLGLPSDFSTIVMAYNKSMLQRAGIDPPVDDWDWPQFLEVCRRLADPPDHYAVATSTEYNRWPAWVWMNNGDVFNDEMTRCLMDTPASIEGLKFCIDLSLVHNVAPTPSLGLGVTGGLSDTELFSAQRLGLNPTSRYTYKRYLRSPPRFEWDVVPMPRGKSAATTFIWGGNCIMRTTKHPREAWQFLKFMTDARGSALTVEAGNALPVHRPSAEAAVLNRHDRSVPLNDACFLRTIEDAQQAPFPAEFAAFNAAQITIKDAFLGIVPVDEACRRFTRDANDIIGGKVF